MEDYNDDQLKASLLPHNRDVFKWVNRIEVK